MSNELQMFWKEVVWLNGGIVSAFAWKDEENDEKSRSGQSCVVADIRIECLPNA
jgi:hypothetical protein